MEMKYKTADDLSKKIDEFISLCMDGTIPRPTDYRLAEFLGISAHTLDRYYTSGDPVDRDMGDNNIYKGYGDVLKKIIAYREDRLQGQLDDNPKAAGAVAFQLKQKRNGGWTDKQQTEISGNVPIKVTIQTADGKTLDD